MGDFLVDRNGTHGSARRAFEFARHGFWQRPRVQTRNVVLQDGHEPCHAVGALCFGAFVAQTNGLSVLQPARITALRIAHGLREAVGRTALALGALHLPNLPAARGVDPRGVAVQTTDERLRLRLLEDAGRVIEFGLARRNALVELAVLGASTEFRTALMHLRAYGLAHRSLVVPGAGPEQSDGHGEGSHRSRYLHDADATRTARGAQPRVSTPGQMRAGQGAGMDARVTVRGFTTGGG